jgi:hypothetical protein
MEAESLEKCTIVFMEIMLELLSMQKISLMEFDENIKLKWQFLQKYLEYLPSGEERQRISSILSQCKEVLPDV